MSKLYDWYVNVCFQTTGPVTSVTLTMWQFWLSGPLLWYQPSSQRMQSTTFTPISSVMNRPPVSVLIKNTHLPTSLTVETQESLSTTKLETNKVWAELLTGNLGCCWSSHCTSAVTLKRKGYVYHVVFRQTYKKIKTRLLKKLPLIVVSESASSWTHSSRFTKYIYSKFI